MKPVVLALDNTLPSLLTDPLRKAYEFHELAELDVVAPRVQALIGVGGSVITRELLGRFPALKLISIFGVGYDGVDVAAAHEKGIAVTNTPDVLTEDVADLALGLMLTVARRLTEADRYVRALIWPTGTPIRWGRKVSRAKLGIVGLGRIGKAIAQRAQAFDMEIGYTDLAAIHGVPYTFYPGIHELARASDFLIIAAYGGKQTRNLIDASVLDALGTKGYLINVARGSVVDENALIDALKNQRIAGAALDVYAAEPNIPAELIAQDNAVLTPHIASTTHQTRQAMTDLVLANVAAHFAGEKLITPVRL